MVKKRKSSENYRGPRKGPGLVTYGKHSVPWVKRLFGYDLAAIGLIGFLATQVDQSDTVDRLLLKLTLGVFLFVALLSAIFVVEDILERSEHRRRSPWLSYKLAAVVVFAHYVGVGFLAATVLAIL